MNYGKRSTSKKRNALISRTSMLEKRAHVSFIRVLFTALIAVCVMVVCLGIGSFRGVIAGAPDVNDVDISPLGYAGNTDPTAFSPYIQPSSGLPGPDPGQSAACSGSH